jgi:hypothetical protein
MPNVKSLRLPKDLGNFPNSELHEMQLYISRSDIVSNTDSTAMTNLFKLSQPYVIAGIGFSVGNDWADSAGLGLNVIAQIGDTTTADKYATLTMAELGSTQRSGTIWCWEESTGSAVDFITLTLDHGGVSSDAAEGSGDFYLYVIWSPRAEKLNWANRKASVT